METTESKRIFLSHKGTDKGMVIDFKETLDLLGYKPWVDDAAMPAGTELERGLLKGMEESCAAVFFITPSFVDEGFLQTEINYAIREKRNKGDRFAIITLRFSNSDTTVIPVLLQTYVWKTPNSQLEALQEIIRALPVAPGRVDWRSKIVAVTTTEAKIPEPLGMSYEAQAMLKKAAGGNGYIYYFQPLTGTEIQADGVPMIPSNDPRTIARWVGGLEDLQERGFIRDTDLNGEVFQVTREGYGVADRLS